MEDLGAYPGGLHNRAETQPDIHNPRLFLLKVLLSRVRLSAPRGLQPTRLLCPWDSPGKNTGVGSHSFLQGIFPTQGSNPGLLHYRRILKGLPPKKIASGPTKHGSEPARHILSAQPTEANQRDGCIPFYR